MSQTDERGLTEASFGLFSRSTSDGPGPLRALAEKVSDALGRMVADVATLEVRTWTADDVSAAAGGTAGDGVGGPAAGGATLRAFTKVKADGDVDVCVPTRDGVVDEAVWAVHKEAVERALAWRGEVVRLVLGAVSGSR